MSLKDRENIGQVERETWRTVFSRKTKKQSSVALSSVEAEYMAMCQAAKEAVWLTGLLKDFNIELRSPLVIFSNSQGALTLAQNPVFHPISQFSITLPTNSSKATRVLYSISQQKPWWQMSSPRPYPNLTASQLGAWSLWAARAYAEIALRVGDNYGERFIC